MRWFVVPILLLAASAGAQTARYKITKEGQDLGWATVVRTLRDDGSKDVITTVQVGMSRIRTTAKYAADGSTVSRKIDTLGDSDRIVGSTLYRYGSKEVEVVTDDRGKRTVDRSAIPAGTADPSEAWFTRDQPKPGARTEAKVLNGALKWDTRTTEYLGPVGGGHKIRQTVNGKATQIVVDAEGMPLRVEMPEGVLMVRILPKSS